MRRIETPLDVEQAIAGEPFLDEEGRPLDLKLNDAELAAFNQARTDGYLTALSADLPARSAALLTAWEWWCVTNWEPDIHIELYHTYATVTLQWVAPPFLAGADLDGCLNTITRLLEEHARPTERRPAINVHSEGHGTEVFAVAAVLTEEAPRVARQLRDLTRQWQDGHGSHTHHE
jgi:hypothetical protein